MPTEAFFLKNTKARIRALINKSKIPFKPANNTEEMKLFWSSLKCQLEWVQLRYGARCILIS
jgi:hypothetical protein